MSYIYDYTITNECSSYAVNNCPYCDCNNKCQIPNSVNTGEFCRFIKHDIIRVIPSTLKICHIILHIYLNDFEEWWKKAIVNDNVFERWIRQKLVWELETVASEYKHVWQADLIILRNIKS